MIYLFKSDVKVGTLTEGKGEFVTSTGASEPASGSKTELSADVLTGTAAMSVDIVEDDVDKILGQMSGQIEREMNPLLCRHSKKNKCVHCIPLDPWDEQYLKDKDPPIKVS